MALDQNKMFQTIDTILQELDNKERLLLKDIAQRVADEHSASLSSVKPMVQMYIKNKPGFVIKNGRTGGVRKVPATNIPNVMTNVVNTDSEEISE